MATILGYARVSTTGQERDAQLAALTGAGVETSRVFTDKLTGAVNTVPPGLASMIDYARAGDTVVVTAIDRLGRSAAEVTRTIADLGEREILLRALREGSDTATPAGQAVAAIMATLAEPRRAARVNLEICRRPNHPSSLPSGKKQLRRLASTGGPVRELVIAFGIGRATAYRYLTQDQR